MRFCQKKFPNARIGLEFLGGVESGLLVDTDFAFDMSAFTRSMPIAY